MLVSEPISPAEPVTTATLIVETYQKLRSASMMMSSSVVAECTHGMQSSESKTATSSATSDQVENLELAQVMDVREEDFYPLALWYSL